MTSLGLDTGKGAWARSKLDDQSRAHADRLIPLQRRWLARLRQIDLRQLSATDATNDSAVRYQIELALQGAQTFKFGADGFPSPYLLSQLTGDYQSIPDFLHSQHVVADRSDAEAYLARLEEFARVMDEETARARGDAAAGVVPPDFIIGQALEQMRALRTTPVNETDLVASLVQRARQKHISGDSVFARRRARVRFGLARARSPACAPSELALRGDG